MSDLHNQSLVTTIDVNDRLSAGVPGQSGCKNIKYSDFIAQIAQDVTSEQDFLDIINNISIAVASGANLLFASLTERDAYSASSGDKCFVVSEESLYEYTTVWALTASIGDIQSAKVTLRQSPDIPSVNNLDIGNYQSFNFTDATNDLQGIINDGIVGGTVVSIEFYIGQTVAHNYAVTGNYAPILLGAEDDFTFTANKNILFIYDNEDDTWKEIGDTTKKLGYVTVGNSSISGEDGAYLTVGGAIAGGAKSIIFVGSTAETSDVDGTGLRIELRTWSLHMGEFRFITENPLFITANNGGKITYTYSSPKQLFIGTQNVNIGDLTIENNSTIGGTPIFTSIPNTFSFNANNLVIELPNFARVGIGIGIANESVEIHANSIKITGGGSDCAYILGFGKGHIGYLELNGTFHSGSLPVVAKLDTSGYYAVIDMLISKATAWNFNILANSFIVNSGNFAGVSLWYLLADKITVTNAKNIPATATARVNGVSCYVSNVSFDSGCVLIVLSSRSVINNCKFGTTTAGTGTLRIDGNKNLCMNNVAEADMIDNGNENELDYILF